jgi:hypothetical protein
LIFKWFFKFKGVSSLFKLVHHFYGGSLIFQGWSINLELWSITFQGGLTLLGHGPSTHSNDHKPKTNPKSTFNFQAIFHQFSLQTKPTPTPHPTLLPTITITVSHKATRQLPRHNHPFSCALAGVSNEAPFSAHFISAKCTTENLTDLGRSRENGVKFNGMNGKERGRR